MVLTVNCTHIAGAPYLKGADFDYISQLLYVTDYNRGKIIVYDAGLTKEWTILDDTPNPYAIALDLLHGYNLFYTQTSWAQGAFAFKIDNTHNHPNQHYITMVIYSNSYQKKYLHHIIILDL